MRKAKFLQDKKTKDKYDPTKIEPKWRAKWEEEGIYQPDLESARKNYVLAEFAYPSGDLHMGHWFTFSGADIYARKKRMEGYDVFFPNGFDAFGLPAENAAIKRSIHPQDWTRSNIEKMKKQYATMGASFSFDNDVITSEPEYYKWNQWIFIEMFKKGLAYRAKTLSNWCPVDQTVLANEHVEDGKCWRCGAQVEQRQIEQWFLKITDYADRLLWRESVESPSGKKDEPKTKKSSEEDFISGLTRFAKNKETTLRIDSTLADTSSFVKLAKRGVDPKGVEPSRPIFAGSSPKPGGPTPDSAYNKNEELVNGVNWPKSVREAQNQWIGKSEGLIFTAPVRDSQMKIQTFSAHFEAFCADTFVVIAPDHPRLEELIKDVPNKKDILDFCKRILKKRTQERNVEGKTSEGKFSGKYIVDPVGNADLPIWVASYALSDYGTGIVKCSAHDERDFAFAKKYGIRLKPVLFPQEPELRKKVENLEVCYTDMKNGILSEPAGFAGKRGGDVRQDIIKYVEEKGYAVSKTQYHLHDWSVSRQRYWGTPVPMIHCPECGIVPVPEEDLPVELPYDVDYTPKGKPPLGTNEEWLAVKCPQCGRDAKRDCETLDTFFDSSWYFFRYLDPKNDKQPFDKLRAKKMMPIDIYFGGAEHTLGHTLYSRFFTKFFQDLGLTDFAEYALRRVNHGVVLGPDGNRMSKSKGNVVNPDLEVKKYGADTIRVYLAFFIPYDGTGPWISDRVWGAYRFLQRVWGLPDKVGGQEDSSQSPEDLRFMHKTIKKVTEDIEKIHFNTAVASLMEWLNHLSVKEKISVEEYETYLKLLAPFAPHITEELYQQLRIENGELKNKELSTFNSQLSIHRQPWPKFDPKFLKEDTVTIAVQVNGKMRDTFKVQSSKFKVQNYVEKIATESEKVKKYLEGKVIKKVIYVPGKVINFVV